MGWTTHGRGHVDATVQAHFRSQTLGQQLGHVRINCIFRAPDMKWTASGTTDCSAILYFDFKFSDGSAIPLKLAAVNIDVGEGPNQNSTPTIEVTEPSAGIVGSPMSRLIRRERKIDPQLGLGGAGLSGNISGFVRQENEELTEAHRWCFEADSGSSSNGNALDRATFRWTRTLLEDCSGANRTYIGAIAVDLRSTEPFTLRVCVDIRAWHWYHRIFRSSSRERQSDPIEPPPNGLLTQANFEQHKEKLRNQIEQRNCGSANLQVVEVRTSVNTSSALDPARQGAMPVVTSSSGSAALQAVATSTQGSSPSIFPAASAPGTLGIVLAGANVGASV